MYNNEHSWSPNFDPYDELINNRRAIIVLRNDIYEMSEVIVETTGLLQKIAIEYDKLTAKSQQDRHRLYELEKEILLLKLSIQANQK